jgi:hypothetical protein
MFFGALLVVGLTLSSLLDPGGSTRAALARGGAVAAGTLFIGCAACAVGGFVGLLAGISAKPRPSGAIGAGLYATGMVLLCVVTAPR